MAGFPLALVLAQVRVTGSVDPHWVRPLVHLAARCPVVLGRLARDLRSIPEFLGYSDWPENLIRVVPQLGRLRSCPDLPSDACLSALPNSLTELSLKEWFHDAALLASLQRFTNLEDLDLNTSSDVDWSLGIDLPNLLQLRCSRPPLDLGQAVPNLMVLQSELEVRDMPNVRLLSSLTQLVCFSYPGPLSLLSGLVGIRRLALSEDVDWSELPDLLAALTRLTWLQLHAEGKDKHLDYLAKALARGAKDLELHLYGMNWSSATQLERFFGHLVDTGMVMPSNVSFPLAALTRLTSLELEVERRNDSSWVKALSQLPALRELRLKLHGHIPAGLGALTQCRELHLRDVRIEANLIELKRLRQLHSFSCWGSPVDCLAFLPDNLESLSVDDACFASYRCPPIGPAVQCLTSLEYLSLAIPWGSLQVPVRTVLELSPLRRLTRLDLEHTRPSLVRLGPLPCLRKIWMKLPEHAGLNEDFMRQLGRLDSLEDVSLALGISADMNDAMLAPLGHLSMLRMLSIACASSLSPEGIQSLLDLPLLEKLNFIMDRAPSEEVYGIADDDDRLEIEY